MKTVKFLCALVISGSFAISCGGDDDPEVVVDDVMTTDDIMTTDDGEVNTVAEEREMTITTLTVNNGGVWRIAEATLTNTSGSYDISSNFNVVDDEFIFSGTVDNGSLEWRPGNDIAVDGGSSEETLLDFYRAPITSRFSFEEDSGTMLTGLDGDLVFEVSDETTITGTLTFSEGRSLAGETLDITLAPKTAEDYASAPESGLTFSGVANFDAYPTFAQQNNVGFVGSNADNSLYIAYRNDDNPEARSRILKYSINTNTFTERNDSFIDFFTRKLDIVNNQIILTGGNNIYTYDLDLSAEPAITPHNAGNLSRYSTATIGDDVFVVGGDLDETADKLRKINSDTGELDIIAMLPAPKVHAGSAFVNDNLYIFSGREAFFDNSTVSAASFIYNVNNEEFTSFDLPVALNNSYASRKENLIYIIGDIQIDNDNDGEVDDFDVWAGVYNTFDGSVVEINHDIDDSDQSSFVHAMTVFNNKMYVIFGSRLEEEEGVDNVFQILSADLN